jgi:tetratricopeptide (TPR) repeat protein
MQALCVAALFFLGVGTGAAQSVPADPDELYRQRETIANAERAAEIWATRASTDFEAAWKLARAYYWIGTHQPQSLGRRTLERGIEAGEHAIRLADHRPEGHFWLAANMGRLAQSFGISQGIKYRGRIKSELERVLKIDPGFQNGSADDALGQWYDSVPRLFGGSGDKAERHFQSALARDPENTSVLMSLAQKRFDDGKRDEARVFAQRVLDAPLDPEWAPEEREFKAKATALLEKLRRSK